MEVKTLYKFERPDGGTTISPVQPDVPFTTRCRIIAAEGMCVTKDGVNLFACIDADSPDGWHEVEAPEELTE